MESSIASELGNDPLELSIIIPAYNEEKRIGPTLERVHSYFASGPGAGFRDFEIIVVDDGSSDRTVELVKSFAPNMPTLRVVSNGVNHGKGFSVRHGMREARGSITLFTDADLSSPIEESCKLLEGLAAGHEIAIGSRAVDRSLIEKHQSRTRELGGIIFNRFVRLFTGLRFHDTQCGFKAFLREPCRIIFEQQSIERFGFDPEILFLAKRHGLKIVEVPVRWAHDPATKVHMLRDSLLMFSDLVYIRWNCMRGRYPRRAEH